MKHAIFYLAFHGTNEKGERTEGYRTSLIENPTTEGLMDFLRKHVDSDSIPKQHVVTKLECITVPTFPESKELEEFEQHDVVYAKEDISESTENFAVAGDIGAIVHIHSTKMVSVEFSNPSRVVVCNINQITKQKITKQI